MKFLTHSHLLIALFVLSVGVIPMAEANCSSGACVQVWSDEFNGTSLDLNKWEPMIGTGTSYGLPSGWGNSELQYYRAENATVANGELTITAKQQNFGGKNYTSARLRTKGMGDWTYGRFEMRAKLPTGQGMWPAFWMLPTSSPYGGWARSGEIDIMEIVGNEPDKIYGTIHYHDNWPDNWSSGTSTTLTPPGTAKNDFHIYAVEWEADEIRWYIDGNLYQTITWWDSVGNPFPAPFDVDFHLLLNLAVGGVWPGNPNGSTVFPQEYVIDYVRVYQPDNNQPQILVFDDMEHASPIGNGWFNFPGAVGAGGLSSNASDLPPENGGDYSIQTGWGSGGNPGDFGGFGRYHPVSIPSNLTEFSMWINPEAGQDYNLDINLKEDDTGDGNADDEFTFGCAISPSGPCAVAGGGWQLVTIPFANFAHDPLSVLGGNGVFDPVSPANGGNGELKEIVMTVFSNTGADVTFRTDYWTFNSELVDADSDGISDALDNCTNVVNPGQQDADGDGYGNICDADFNNNCFVNVTDLGLMKLGFGGTDAELDLDSSGFVNSIDLGILKTVYGGNPGPSATDTLGCSVP